MLEVHERFPCSMYAWSTYKRMSKYDAHKGGCLSIVDCIHKGGCLSIVDCVHKGGCLSIVDCVHKGGCLSIVDCAHKGGCLSIVDFVHIQEGVQVLWTWKAYQRVSKYWRPSIVGLKNIQAGIQVATSIMGWSESLKFCMIGAVFKSC